MCNWLLTPDPENTWEIPSKGFGYKIFCRLPNGQVDPYVLRSFCDLDYYDPDDDGWVTWKEPNIGVGFCFFKTREDAEMALKRWNVGRYSQGEKILHPRNPIPQWPRWKTRA
jgi:hypothetical protein